MLVAGRGRGHGGGGIKRQFFNVKVGPHLWLFRRCVLASSGVLAVWETALADVLVCAAFMGFICSGGAKSLWLKVIV